MDRTALRRLALEGRIFLWRRAHQHRPADAGAGAEVLTVYEEAYRASPLRVTFRAHGEWQVGCPASPNGIRVLLDLRSAPKP